MMILDSQRDAEVDERETLSAEEIALEIKRVFEEISPLIESFTSLVCPTCVNVCCRHKHSLYDEEDRLFLNALGVGAENNLNLDPEGPCEFLKETGCVRPRWLRPFRCTWYFCEGLLKYMPEASGKRYREMVKKLNDLIELRKKLLSIKKAPL